jgi:penicillin-binding protein 2|tara:strand:+ start:28291 stop:30129 length:1839 start_codon:yes stop_codon:yes gene_type:complete
MGILFAILLTGMAYQQLFKYGSHREKEARQNYRRILLPGPRGNVYDRDGRLLVGNRPVFNAVVTLNELRPEFRAEYRKRAAAKDAIQQRIDRSSLNIESRSAVVQRYLNNLNRLLDTTHVVDSNGLERHFRRSLLLPYTLVNDLPPEDYAHLIEQIPVESPIQVITDSARYYPHGKAACHVLGFVSNTDQLNAADVPGEDLLTFHFEGKVGRSGIERIYDEELQGRSGGEVWSVDPGGYQHELIAQRSPIQGNDLVTTIDLDLQLTAERALVGKSGALAAIDITTGEVLAMASLPNYDVNDLTPFLSYAVDERIREEGGWLNRAAQGLYPPGSTFKIVTATAALRESVIDRSTVVECPGYYLVGHRTFRCHRHSGHGPETLEEAIRDSCNVFFYDRSAEMGAAPIIEEARRFGFDEPTGIELYGETRGMHVPDGEWKKDRTGEGWYGGDTANLSIGQGYLLSTPLQVACFAASIARGETRTRPTLLKDNFLRKNRRKISEPIGLPAGDFQRIIQGMKDAGSIGTARLAAVNTGVAVAGKTGTAQVRKEGKPTTIAWYMGFAPADDPKIAIAIAIEGIPGESSLGGGADAAPIAAQVFRAYFEKMSPANPSRF